MCSRPEGDTVREGHSDIEAAAQSRVIVCRLLQDGSNNVRAFGIERKAVCGKTSLDGKPGGGLSLCQQPPLKHDTAMGESERLLA